MKKTDWAILICTAAYSILFYDQSPGINFLIFSVLCVIFLLTVNFSLIREKNWILYAGLSIYTGICVLIYGSLLATWANIICLFLLAAASINNSSSVFLNLFSSIYSSFGSLIFIIMELFNKQAMRNRKLFQKSLTILFPLFFIIIFFLIYKSSNPLFKIYTRYINLDFISVGWFFFTISGFLLVYGFFKNKRIDDLDQLEKNQPIKLEKKDIQNWFVWNEKTAASILFITLNVMLLLSNALDINYLYLGAGLPAGITHKQFVHNGVGLLVLSILIGIFLIIFFFRGNLNFENNNKFLKILVYLWIIQNLIMIYSTGIRNNIYILDALLTYKRIGIYFWLLICAIGLSTAIIKVAKIRSGWYLFKLNTFIAFLIFAFSASADWDKIISDYNIGKMQRNNIAPFDKHYLLDLSETNIAAMWNLQDKVGFEVDSTYSYRAYYIRSNKQWLHEKLYNFIKKYQENGWQSYNLRDQRIMAEISGLYNNGLLDSVQHFEKKIPLASVFLSHKKITDIKPEKH